MAKKVVIGIVESQARAESALSALKNAGFSGTDISVLFPDQAGTRDFAHEKNTKAPEGAIAGVGAGGAIGGTLGLLAGIGTLAIPGLGPFIAAGPIMAALSGAAAGATVGGIAGALIGLGIPELEAKRYAGKVQNGNILMSIHTESSEEVGRAKKVLEAAGAQDVSTAGEARVPAKERDQPSPSNR
jgi:hypothetical protein